MLLEGDVPGNDDMTTLFFIFCPSINHNTDLVVRASKNTMLDDMFFTFPDPPGGVVFTQKTPFTYPNLNKKSKNVE